MEITTPNGYKVFFKRDYLTYGENRKLQEIYLKGAKFDLSDPNNPKTKDFDPSTYFEAQKFVFERLIDKIITPDGKEVKENLYQFAMDLRQEDGEAIFAKIDELTAPSVEKKR